MAVDSNWLGKKKITIDNTKVSGAANLSNFPVLIKDGNIPSDVYSALKLGTHMLDLELGSLQYAKITDASQTGLDLGTRFSLMGRVRYESLPGNSDRRGLIGKYESTGDQRSYFFNFFRDSSGNGSLEFASAPNGNATGIVTLREAWEPEAGVDYHIAVTVDTVANETKFYVNADQIGTTNTTSVPAPYNGTADVEIGALNGDAKGDGKYKNVRIYSDIRTATEIAQDMNSNSITDANLEADWAFDNAYTDGSGNGNTLTAVNSPTFATDVPSLSNQLRFTTDEAGATEIPFEIVNFDSVDEEAQIWVKVPTVDYNDDTIFYMHYDNDEALPYAPDDTYGSENVWSSQYKAVYHAEHLLDSTSNDKTLSKTGTVNNLAGKIANGFDAAFADNTNHLLNTAVFSPGTGDFRISAWFKRNGLPANDFTPTILSLGNSGGSIRATLEATKANGYLQGQLVNSGSDTATTTSNICDNTAHKIVISRSGTTVKLYLDGVEAGSGVTSSKDISDDDLHIGFAGLSSGFDSIGQSNIDEIRVENAAATLGWETTEYNNQNSPSTFLTITDVSQETGNMLLMF